MFSSSTYEDTYEELELIGKGSFGTKLFYFRQSVQGHVFSRYENLGSKKNIIIGPIRGRNDKRLQVGINPSTPHPSKHNPISRLLLHRERTCHHHVILLMYIFYQFSW